MSREGAIGYCNGKVCYTKKDAQTKRNFLSRHRNKRGRKTQILRVYQCEECDFFHLTKKGVGIKDGYEKNKGTQRKNKKRSYE